MMAVCGATLAVEAAPDGWPEAPADARPWLQLSAVELERSGETPDVGALADAGFGGVVFPATFSDREVWKRQARETSEEAGKWQLGFDLRLNDFNLPTTELDELRAQPLIPFEEKLKGGSELRLKLPAREVDTIGAWPPQGPPVDLTGRVDEKGELVWNAPAGSWHLFGLTTEKAGRELDPFSPYSMALWLDFHEKPFPEDAPPMARAGVFERSARTSGDWTPEMTAAFQRLRGYDLREELPALFGESDAGQSMRVTSDYRETLGDLMLESLGTWHDRCREEGVLSRSIIRGNPGHPVDLHAIADIPGVLSADDPPFAASAAHFALKPLVSGIVSGGLSSTPDAIRRKCEALWLRGANQVVLGPIDENLQPGLPALNSWITRIQSILQSGAPDPDVLLYFPYHDFLASRGGLPDDPDERLDWIASSGFGHAMRAFDKAGIAYDIVSDRLLATATATDGRIILGGLTYAAVILPEVQRLPETTAGVLRDLSRRSGRVGILGDWPTDVPGFPSPDIRRGTLVQALQDISRVVEEDDPIELAAALGIEGEAFARTGLRGIRRHHAEGHHYWVINPTDSPITTEFQLSRPALAAVLLDPAIPERHGLAPSAVMENGKLRISLELGAQESRLIRTFREMPTGVPGWPDALTGLDLRGTWELTFADESTLATPLLGSWRTLADPSLALTRSSVRYRLDCDIPEGTDSWLLDLGKVAHVARVSIDGKPAGSTFGQPSTIALPPLPAGPHRLEIDVSAMPESEDAGLLGPVRLIPLVGASEN